MVSLLKRQHWYSSLHDDEIDYFGSRSYTSIPTTMTEETIPSQPCEADQSESRLVLLVPKVHVKDVKSSLERHKRFDRNHGIRPDPLDLNHSPAKEQRMRVHTTLPYTTEDIELSADAKTRLLAELQLDRFSQNIELSSWNPSKTERHMSIEHSPLRKALRDALESLAPDVLASLTEPHHTIDYLVSTFPDSYSIYKPLLLLPSNSLGTLWNTLLSRPLDQLQPIWHHVAQALRCTHVAINSPIPPSNTPSSAHSKDAENILRSPVNLTPIHGSFGPFPTPQTLSNPSQQDFTTALWVRTTQNGIHQTWAPLYTMFSRGNVKEKARILHLASATDTAETKTPATAVDMYAGIGYFSFSYRSAGIQRVVCWELNPWSVEGLRRGAALNNWRTRVFTSAHVPARDARESEWDAWREGVVGGCEDFWVFQMSNETAERILRCLKLDLPPVRHVNLGLLPMSRASWGSAVGALDKGLGGWVHAHENVGLVEMDERRVEVETEFQKLVRERDVSSGSVSGDTGAQGRKACVEHVEKVKMYAPGVVHAVFDVYVPGTDK